MVDLKYGFPLFTKNYSTEYLLRNDSIRVSDIWSFWNYIVRKNSKCNKNSELNFNFSLLEQAKYLYDTATTAPMKSQPLLYYYSFLNLAKIVINMSGFKGDNSIYYHGIDTKVTSNTTFETSSIDIKRYDPLNNKFSVAYELMKEMECPMPPTNLPYSFNVKDLMKACIGTHRTYSEIYQGDETYHHIKDIQLNRKGKKLTFQSTVSKINLDQKLSLCSNGYNIESIVDDYEIESFKWTEEYIMPHYNITLNDYYCFSKQLRDKGVWAYTDGKEYRMYISDNHIRITSECIIYFLMFFSVL